MHGALAICLQVGRSFGDCCKDGERDEDEKQAHSFSSSVVSLGSGLSSGFDSMN